MIRANDLDKSDDLVDKILKGFRCDSGGPSTDKSTSRCDCSSMLNANEAGVLAPTSTEVGVGARY